MRRRVPDNTKARDLVGFDPRTTLDDIITTVARDRSTTPDAQTRGLAGQLVAS